MDEKLPFIKRYYVRLTMANNVSLVVSNATPFHFVCFILDLLNCLPQQIG
jgi:hypothetical protein